MSRVPSVHRRRGWQIVSRNVEIIVYRPHRFPQPDLACGVESNMPHGVLNQFRSRRPFADARDQNYGACGVVYILKNEAFKEGWIKIGQSQHSGHVRARDMNRKATTGIPKHHVCIFECKTLDCGRAEKAVFAALKDQRKGQQEFFEVDFELAKTTIFRECAVIDAAIILARKTAREEQCDDDDVNAGQYPQPGQGVELTIKIDVTCPNCKGALTVSDPEGSQRIRCPTCKFVFAKADVQTIAPAMQRRELAGIWPLVFGAVGLIFLATHLENQNPAAKSTGNPDASTVAVTDSMPRTRLPEKSSSAAMSGITPPVRNIASEHDLIERIRHGPALIYPLEKGEAWLVAALPSEDTGLRLLIQFRPKANDDLMLNGVVTSALSLLQPQFCDPKGLLSTYSLKSLSISLTIYENNVRIGDIPLPRGYCRTRVG